MQRRWSRVEELNVAPRTEGSFGGRGLVMMFVLYISQLDFCMSGGSVLQRIRIQEGVGAVRPIL